MRLWEMIALVWTNIRVNAFKVMMTSLGIIVGTATIVMVIAIGKGGEQSIKDQFAFMNANTIYINPNYNQGVITDMDKMPRFDFSLLEQLMSECPTLSKLTLLSNGYNEVRIGSEKDYLPNIAITEDYAAIFGLQAQIGELFDEVHLEDEERVVVIGETLALKYFSTVEDALDQWVTINNKRFKIIGILEKKNDTLQGVNADESLFLPFTTAVNHAFTYQPIPQVIGMVNDIKDVKQAMGEIEFAMRYLLDEEASQYLVQDAGSRIKAATKSATTMSMLLFAVAMIVFVVGGIGIMNVLFVSVKERTKEIGILKALGASKRDILLQFLMESIFIGAVGGVIGVIVSVGMLPLLKNVELVFVASLEGYMIAFIFAIMTGTIFGFYPAYKASKLRPIEALNYE